MNCGQCDHPLTPGEQDFFTKILALPEFDGHTAGTLGVICCTCSVLEQDPNAPHKGGEREHVHIFPPKN